MGLSTTNLICCVVTAALQHKCRCVHERMKEWMNVFKLLHVWYLSRERDLPFTLSRRLRFFFLLFHIMPLISCWHSGFGLWVVTFHFLFESFWTTSPLSESLWQRFISRHHFSFHILHHRKMDRADWKKGRRKKGREMYDRAARDKDKKYTKP